MKLLTVLNNSDDHGWRKNLKIKKGFDETGIIHETRNVPFVSGHDEGGPFSDWFSLWSDVE